MAKGPHADATSGRFYRFDCNAASPRSRLTSRHLRPVSAYVWGTAAGSMCLFPRAQNARRRAEPAQNPQELWHDSIQFYRMPEEPAESGLGDLVREQLPGRDEALSASVRHADSNLGMAIARFGLIDRSDQVKIRTAQRSDTPRYGRRGLDR
jgi:hypothetical protein